MPTFIVQPVNIVYGEFTPVVSSGQAIGYGTKWCVIFNTTQAILQVNHIGGTSYIQPNSADVFPVMTGVYPTVSVPNVPSVPLIFTAPGNAPLYVGTITTMFFDANDPEPGGYPQTLNPFASGGLVIANELPPTNDSTILVPVGTNQLVFSAVGGVTGTLFVLGTASGHTYYNGVFTAGTSEVIQVPTANNDTLFGIATTGITTTIYAS